MRHKYCNRMLRILSVFLIFTIMFVFIIPFAASNRNANAIGATTSTKAGLDVESFQKNAMAMIQNVINSVVRGFTGLLNAIGLVKEKAIVKVPAETGVPAGTKAPTADTVPVDNTPPVLILIGSNIAPMSNTSISGYSDPGAIAADDIDGAMGIVYSSTIVNATVLGKKEINYTATDKSGNMGTITRIVNVVAKMDPLKIPQFKTPLLIPWAMPKSKDPNPTANTDYYEIAMRQFTQQLLPAGLPSTTVWGYGTPGGVFNAPSLTIEATSNKPVRIKWINDLKDANGNYLPHLLPIDQTISSYPNLAGDMATTPSQKSYVGPVPIVTHVHGAHVVQESDGYPDAWYFPDAGGIQMGYTTTGPKYDPYRSTAQSGSKWTPGNAIFDYANDQRDSTLWYHDHAMGLTRTNVYAGPAGFYLIRDLKVAATNSATGAPAILPGPAPLTQDEYTASILTGSVYEIPIAIQDRAFNTDGSLFYPGSRMAFDDYAGPYAPDSDVNPVWNPEFFGDTILVNGNTWPTLNVQPKKYRIRFLNGSQARTFILGLKNLTTPAKVLYFWQIGSDGGFLAAPANLKTIIMMPAERVDVIIDFSTAVVGDKILLSNIGPDSPFKGGTPVKDFPVANPATTGKVMQFKVIASDGKSDLSTKPGNLRFPAIIPLVPTKTTPVRRLSLNEITSTVTDPSTSESIGPIKALLGTVSVSGGVITANPKNFMDTLSENIKLNDTEIWEIYNFTEDAHPIHLHLVSFQVVNRQEFDMDKGILGKTSTVILPPAGESGYKDTVMALPGQVTRIRAKFDKVGLYVWHCHILEHEDNEMMRPFEVK